MTETTNEWAMQLAHDYISSDLDFTTMKICIASPAITRVRYMALDGVHDLDLNKLYDPINNEITRLAYDPNQNTLWIGGTYDLTP